MEIPADVQLRRLTDGAYAEISSEQNNEIWSWVTAPPGARVMEIGCGYGKLISNDPHRSRIAIGLDYELNPLVAGKQLWGERAAAFVQGSTFMLPFADRSFHTVILRESLHHFKEHGGNVTDALKEIARICSDQLIVFDPNVNLILKASRWLVKHEDEVCNWPEAVEAMEQAGFKLQAMRFRDILAFPLSGGLVAPEFVRANTSSWKLVRWGDQMARRLLERLPLLQRQLCWRYLLVGIRTN